MSNIDRFSNSKTNWPSGFPLTNQLIPYVGILALCVVLFLIQSCAGKDDDPVPPEPTEQEKVTALLTQGTWRPQSVVVSGVDVTADLFDGFTITFTASQFTTTGTTPIWLRTDTWQFKGASTTVIIRGQDGKEVTISSVTESELKLSLEWDETTFGGRTKSLPGKYDFTMIK